LLLQLHSSLYDKDSEGYYTLYKADKPTRFMLTDYNSFVSELVKINSYSDMHTVLSINSVT